MKGLSFSEPMVKAWMEGQKSVTRRLMNPQPLPDTVMIKKDGRFYFGMRPDPAWVVEVKPRYLAGEMVYIKETWGITEWYENSEHKEEIVYKATEPTAITKWKSPRFMPAWAARSHALILSVMPERIREITEEEAKREGVSGCFERHLHYDGREFRCSFEYLWDSLHPGSWERNDWVWRIELEKKHDRPG